MIKKITNLLKKPGFWLGLAIFIVLIYLFSQPPSIKVLETSPKDQTKEVLVTEKIVITFSRTPSKNEQDNIKVESDPNQNFKLNWQNNNLTATPQNPLKESTSYSINISLTSKNIYKFSFKTASISYSQIVKDVQEQSVSDYQFNQALKKFYDQYPWYRKLPIETSDYRIVYDFQKNQFRIRILKPNANSSDQTNIVNDALSALKKIGVPEPISYYILK